MKDHIITRSDVATTYKIILASCAISKGFHKRLTYVVNIIENPTCGSLNNYFLIEGNGSAQTSGILNQAIQMYNDILG